MYKILMGDVTAIVNIFKRPHILDSQIEAIIAYNKKANEVNKINNDNKKKGHSLIML